LERTMRYLKNFILPALFILIPFVCAAQTTDIASLEAMPYAIVCHIDEAVISSRTVVVSDETVAGGKSILMNVKNCSSWSCQWPGLGHKLAPDVPYKIYAVLRARKTGDIGDALEMAVHGKSGTRRKAPARQVKNMVWQAWEIATITVDKKFKGYPHTGIFNGNGANVPEAWFVKFIAVPQVTPTTELALKRHYAEQNKQKQKLARLMAQLKNNPVKRPPAIMDRFAFGIYVAFEQFHGIAELYNEPWQARWRRICEDLVRARMNAIPIVNSPWQLAKGDFSMMDDILRIAAEVGIDVMPGAGGLPVGQDYEAAQKKLFEPMVRRYANAPALLSWYLWDEPGAETRFFLPLLNARLICDKIAPSKSATLITCYRNSTKTYAPYLPVIMPDKYSVSYKRRDPWRVGKCVKMTRNYSAHRIWMMHQLYENMEGRGSAAMPTAGELKLMSYLAVAEGAAGLMPYHYIKKSLWHHERYATRAILERATCVNSFECHIDLWEVHKEIGARMRAVGPLLVGAEFLGTKGVTATARNIRTYREDSVEGLVTRLFKPKGGSRILVIVNNDPVKDMTGEVLLAEPPAKVYDLFKLKAVKAPGGKIRVALPPGECLIALLGDEKAFEAARVRILANSFECERAIARLDVLRARRFKVDCRRAEMLQAEALKEAEAKNYAAALALIKRCAQSARDAVEADAKIARAGKILSEAQINLGRLDNRLGEKDMLFNAEIRHRGRKLIAEVGAEYFELLNQYNAGKGREIISRAESLLKKTQGLRARMFGGK